MTVNVFFTLFPFVSFPQTSENNNTVIIKEDVNSGRIMPYKGWDSVTKLYIRYEAVLS